MVGVKLVFHWAEIQDGHFKSKEYIKNTSYWKYCEMV